MTKLRENVINASIKMSAEPTIASDKKSDLNCGQLEVILSEYKEMLLDFPESHPPDIPIRYSIILKYEIPV